MTTLDVLKILNKHLPNDVSRLIIEMTYKRSFCRHITKRHMLCKKLNKDNYNHCLYHLTDDEKNDMNNRLSQNLAFLLWLDDRFKK